MGNVEIYNVEQGSNAWHELRIGRITGSRFSDLMAGESTATYKGLVYEMIGQILSETTEESYSNQYMERGKELEPEARQFYEEQNDLIVEEVGFVTNLDIYPEYIGVSPDGVIDKGLLEIKCPIMKTHIGYLESSKLPNTYKWQVQGQLLITGQEFCDFMSYYPGIKPFVITVEPDKEMHEQLLERINKTVNIIQEKVNKYK